MNRSDRYSSPPSLGRAATRGPRSEAGAGNGKHPTAPEPAFEIESASLAGRFLAICDYLLGAIVLFGVIFGPWAFGTTQPWSVRTMTGAGLVAWGVLAAKWLTRWAATRWPIGWLETGGTSTAFTERRIGRALAMATALMLLYCLTSAWNARATYHPESWSFDYHDALLWLPHSYDSESSWQVFWVYLGVAGIFWAARNWILSGKDVAVPATRHGRRLHDLPSRLRLILWVLSINGALVGLEAIIQRTSGTNRLLWLVVPRVNSETAAQFGPYAYRANAAQYFNLIWPVTLGFWWVCHKGQRGRGLVLAGSESLHHLLLSFVLIMAICPLVSISRGGAIITAASVLLAGLVLLLAQWRSPWPAKLGVFVLVATILGVGLLLGWEELGPRLEMMQQGRDNREALFITGRQMASAQPLFGTGPGTFGNLFQLFRRTPSDYWPAQQHNDWLETLITFGWAGSMLVGLGLVTVLSRWFFRGGIYGEKHLVMLIWIALGGCLLHAYYDFPFQVHSVLSLFVLLCAILSCLSRES